MIPLGKGNDKLRKLYIVDDRGLRIMEFFISKKDDRPHELDTLADAIRSRFEQEEKGRVSFGRYSYVEEGKGEKK